jgi:hypothetical protein
MASFLQHFSGESQISPSGMQDASPDSSCEATEGQTRNFLCMRAFLGRRIMHIHVLN